MDSLVEQYKESGGKGFIYKSEVIFIKESPFIKFPVLLRSALRLPDLVNFLRDIKVFLKVTEDDNFVSMIVNRKIITKTETVPLFLYSKVWSIRLPDIMVRDLEIDEGSNIYIKKDIDDKLICSSKYIDGAEYYNVIGSDGYFIVCLSRIMRSYDRVYSKYTIVSEPGVCVLTPHLYHDEITLIYKGSGIMMPIGSFYEKLLKEEVDGRLYVYLCVDEVNHSIGLFKGK